MQQKVIDIKVHCIEKQIFCQYIKQVLQYKQKKKTQMIACLILHRGDAMNKLFE